MKYSFKKWLKKKTSYYKPILFFLYHLLFFCIGGILYVTLDHVTFLSNSFKETAISDVDFSDLYYQNQKTSHINDSIIIINSGSIEKIPGYGRRIDMLHLMRKLTDSCSPKKIGIDLEYTDSMNKETDNALNELFKNDKFVLAKSKQNTSILKGVTTGNVNFPQQENHAVRNYYFSNKVDDTTSLNSFANVCLNKKLDISTAGREFYLKYYCKGKGYYNILDKQNEEETAFAFPAIEARDILNNFSAADFKKFFDHKIVLVGHLGEGNMHNPDDIGDKHKTPTDFQFVFKTKIMPGVVIHANAIRQLQLDDQIMDFDWISYIILSYFLTFIFLIIFSQIKRLKNYYIRFVVDFLFATLSIVFIHFVVFNELSKSIHINSFYIGLILLSLAELKGAFFYFYEKCINSIEKPKK